VARHAGRLGAVVKVVYELSAGETVRGEGTAGERKTFMRRINQDGSSTFYIDHSIVGWDDYKQVLGDLNILVSARNFLVFQVGVLR
jgi:chromosome segregation ATPase